MITLFQLAGVLRGELFAVGIEHDQRGKAEAHGITVTSVDVCVVSFAIDFVHVHQHEDIIGAQIGRDVFVGLKQLVQFVTPTAPVRTELQKDVFVLAFGDRESIGDLLRTIRSSIVDIFRAGGFGISVGGREGAGQESEA